jgi:hypothetical protein
MDPLPNLVRTLVTVVGRARHVGRGDGYNFIPVS